MISLFDLAAEAVESNFFNVADKLLKKKSTSHIDIAEQLGRLSVQVQDTPANLHPEIAERCLVAADKLSRARSSKKRKFAIETIVSMTNRSQVKNVIIDFSSNPSNTFNAAILNIFSKTNHLRTIDCYFGSNVITSSLTRQQFVNACPNFVNLTSFLGARVCDEILKALCEHCPLIQELYFDESKKVTDSCISSLVRCQKLRSIGLSTTRVSNEGYVQLLMHAQSALVDIGEIRDLSKLLDQLRNDVVPFRSFQLRTLFCSEFDSPNFELVAYYFPQLTELTMECFPQDDDWVLDLAALDRMEHMQRARLIINCFSNDLMYLSSSVLTSLRLLFDPDDLHSPKIDIADIMKIGVQCPNIERLELFAFEFLDNSASVEFYKLLGNPFPKLRKLRLSNCSDISCFRFILRHTFCIESISLYKIDGTLTDIFDQILKVNPLERLKTLDFQSENNLSAHLLKNIIINCKQLSYLGNFKNFVALSEDEKREITNLIIKR